VVELNVVIFGAGKVGLTLLQLLENSDHGITIVDKNKEVCDLIASESRAVVVHGDCTDPELLDSLKLEGMDFVVGVSGEEEVNFLAAIYAKQAGARHIIARSNSRQHSAILQKLGIDAMIPEITLARDLANQIVNPTIFAMLNPGESNVELFEIQITKKQDGEKVHEAVKHPGVSILALFDGKKFSLPKPTDRLKAGTIAIVVSTSGKRSLE